MKELFKIQSKPLKENSKALNGISVFNSINIEPPISCILEIPSNVITICIRKESEDEKWYIEKGCGQIWFTKGEKDFLENLTPGKIALLRKGLIYQIKNTSNIPLKIIASNTNYEIKKSELLTGKGYWDRYENSKAHLKKMVIKKQQEKLINNKLRKIENNLPFITFLEKLNKRELAIEEKLNASELFIEHYSLCSEEKREAIRLEILKEGNLKGKQWEWEKTVLWYMEINAEFDYELAPMIQLIQLFGERGLWKEYFPSTSHDSLGLSRKDKFEDRLNAPMIYIRYDSENNKFSIHFQEGQGNEIKEKDCGAKITDGDIIKIEAWLKEI